MVDTVRQELQFELHVEMIAELLMLKREKERCSALQPNFTATRAWDTASAIAASIWDTYRARSRPDFR
jgi:hypothetical protein